MYWIQVRAEAKSASMLAEKNIFHEAEFFRTIVKDKIMKVLYEVSSIPEDVIETNAIKAAIDEEM